jgi:hypothetical protein
VSTMPNVTIGIATTVYAEGRWAGSHVQNMRNAMLGWLADMQWNGPLPRIAWIS